jgi:hypothetical protein
VADRLPDPKILYKDNSRPLEVRLLAIEPSERNNTMFFGLVWMLYVYAQKNGYTHLFISAFEDRLELYRGLGFEALGPAVCSGQARFVPMSIPAARLAELNARSAGLWEHRVETQSREPVCDEGRL